MDDNHQADICRVCHSEGSVEKPLYHPCICTGSIKYIHQDCLVQWLRYSEKEYCELCNYRFSFIPIYSPDMPKRLPIRDIVMGLFGSLATAIKYWLHYSIVAIAWLGIVPISAYRIYRCLFMGSFTSVVSLLCDLLSTKNIASDGFYGCCVVTCTFCAFLSIVWLREQIIRGGGPEWLEPQIEQQAPPRVEPVQANHNDPGFGLNNNINNNNMGEDVDLSDDDELEIDEEDNLIAPDVGIPNEAANENHPIAIVAPNNNQQGNAAQVDNNWNPVEWDRAAEDLTWERILGLDGSLLFLEHVFWIVSLNTLFIFIFAYFPFNVGAFAVKQFGIIYLSTSSNFDGLLITLFGYIIVGMVLVFFHSLTSLFKFRRIQRFLGLSYVIIKVSILLVFEVGIFPLIFGWIFDICSLPLLGATLADRQSSFQSAPGTSMFIHWLVGMVYIFYFASFIILLREVVRPGVLWFMQNLNDPDFNPIQEMIHLSLYRHYKKFICSSLILCTTLFLMIWFPICIIQKFLPDFLPYNVVQSNDSPFSEVSIEFLILQLILPALLDHAHIRQGLVSIIRSWCIVVSYILGIRSYLLGDENSQRDGLIQVDNNNENTNYSKPRFFLFKMLMLIIFAAISLLIGGLITLTVPVMMGRKLFSFWMGDAKVHELNTASSGLYVTLILARFSALLCSWLPRGWNAILLKVNECVILTCKTLFAGFILLGIIPLLIGLLFDVIMIVPIRVPLNQTPIFYLWQDWAFGVLHSKVICGLSMMGEWGLREILEEIYHAGLVNINLKYIITNLALPAILALGFVLTTPYVIIFGLLPLFGVTFATRNLLIRRIYPFLLIASGSIYLIHWQIKKFCRLYEHIKNDKYLVGKRLVNYDPNKSKSGISSNSKSINHTNSPIDLL